MNQRNRFLFVISLIIVTLVVGLGNSSVLLTDSSAKESNLFNESFTSKTDPIFPDYIVDNYSRITNYDTCFRGTGVCIEIINDLAFIGYSSEGLIIVDIEYSDDPRLLSIYPMQSIVAMEIVGNYAYIIAGWNSNYGTLKIIDIFDPTQPRLVGTYTGMNIYDLAIIGPYAYLVAGTNGLRIINVTNPTKPVEISHYNDGVGNPVAVHINKNYYVLTAEADGGIRIYDCTNLTNPILLGEHFGEGFTCQDIVANEDYAYLATDTAGFIIINIKDYENPSYHNQIDDKSISKIKIIGTTGYFVYDTIGVKIFNVKRFGNPKLINTIEESDITDIYYSDDYLFATTTTNPLEIFDISTPNSEEIISVLLEGFLYHDLVIYEDIAVVATGTFDLLVFDISDIYNPRIKTVYATNTEISDLVIDGSRIYYVDAYNHLKALDVSDSNNIILYENIHPNTEYYFVSDFLVKDNILYLSNNQNSFLIYNVTDLTNVIEMSEILQGIYIIEMFVENNSLYLFANSYSSRPHILEVNITQLDNPVLYANYSLMEFDFYLTIFDLHVSDDIFFITNYHRLQIFEVNATNEFHLLSSYTLNDYNIYDKHVVVKDKCAYLTNTNEVLVILNVSDPSHPTKMGQFSDYRNGQPTAASFHEELILYATSTGGLQLIGKDHDSDGLADYLETNAYSTDIFSEDTDNDMLSDGYEVYFYASSPISLDSDLDTLTDTDEVFLYKTNPASSDTDHDSISDLDEILAGSDPLNPNDPNINYTITSYIGLAESLFFSISFAVMTIGVLLKKRRKK